MVIYYHSYEILKKNLMQIKVFKEYEQCTMCLKHAFKTNKQTKTDMVVHPYDSCTQEAEGD